MIPPAAVAAIRAAVEDAEQGATGRTADVVEHVVAELVAHGWTITPDEAEQAPPRAA